MLEGPQRYPMLRGRRRRQRAWRRLAQGVRLRGGVARWLAAAVLAAALLVAVVVARHRPPADPRHELAESLGLLDVGNYSAARRHAQAAVRARPDWGLAHAVLARIDLALGDGIAAEGELGRAKAAGFDMRRVRQLLAHAYLIQGDATRALDTLGGAAPRYDAYITRVRALALAAIGDVPGAQAVLSARVAAAPNDGDAWAVLARIRYDAGDVAGADAAVMRALALARGNLDALVLKGELVRSRYGLVAALPWFEAPLARDAYYPPALIAYAATLGDAGRYGAMLAATRKALAARPGDPQALYLQAVLAARAGNRPLAEAMLAHTQGAIDHQPGVLLLAGGLDYAAGRFEQAIEKWRELVARQPMNVTARRLLGSALLRSGDAKGALDVLRPIALRADADSYTLGLVGRAFEASGQRDWAARFLDRAAAPSGGGGNGSFGSDDTIPVLADAAAQAPGDPGPVVALIRGLLDAGQGEAALARAQALVRAGPGAPAAQLLLGDTLAALGRTVDAAAAYARAADLRFDEPALLRLVETDERIGRHGDAARALALYLSQNPASDAGTRLLGRAELVAGQWEAAIQTLDRLRARGGGRDALMLAELSAGHAGAGDAVSALGYARAAYRLQPMAPAVVAIYAQALRAAGDARGAAQLSAKLAALQR